MTRVVTVEENKVIVQKDGIIIFEQLLPDASQATELVKLLEANPESSTWECFGVFLPIGSAPQSRM